MRPKKKVRILKNDQIGRQQIGRQCHNPTVYKLVTNIQEFKVMNLLPVNSNIES